jgi:hypothetical protein
MKTITQNGCGGSLSTKLAEALYFLEQKVQENDLLREHLFFEVAQRLARESGRSVALERHELDEAAVIAVTRAGLHRKAA